MYYRIDVDKMRQAAECLVGEHDFKSFCTPRTQVETTVRRVTEISFTQEGNMISMTIKGYGFLYNMVRIIMGTLLKVGTGLMEPEKVKEILDSGNVDMVAMDLKNTLDRYAETVGIPGFDTSKILESINIIRSSGVEYEFRTTVVSPLHRPEDFGELAKMVEVSPRYFLQNFVDSGDLVAGEGMTALTEEELKQALANAKEIIPQTMIRGEE
jgi:pyruvate formate lyase activating enzyme